jgi:hypothetical protein
VRRLIVGNFDEIKNIQVVTTNESPPQEIIPFHHELSQYPIPATHICFYGYVKAIKGGCTPFLRSDLLVDMIHRKYPEYVSKFEEGVKYVRRVP